MKPLFLLLIICSFLSCSKKGTTGSPPTSQSLYELSLKDTSLAFSASLPGGGTAVDSLVLHLKSLDSLGNIVFTGKVPQFSDNPNDAANLYSMSFTLVMTDSKGNNSSSTYTFYKAETDHEENVYPGSYVVSVRIQE
jgi:hypothetical protein